MYNISVDTIFSRNLSVIKKVFNRFTNPKKHHIDYSEVQKILTRAGFNVYMKTMKLCFNESLMSRIDTMSDQSTNVQMSFVEFLVFLARIANEVWDTESDAYDKPLHIKIDRLLQAIFSAFNLTKLFSFEREWELGSSKRPFEIAN